MHILILGSTGFIGSQITAHLIAQGHTVRAAARSSAGKRPARPGLSYAPWDGKTASGLLPLLEGIDAIINLQGENIGAGRWTEPRKQAIVQSRLHAGYALTSALQARRDGGLPLPRTVLQASAWAITACGQTPPALPFVKKTAPGGWVFWQKPAPFGRKVRPLWKQWAFAVACCGFRPLSGKKHQEPQGDFWSGCYRPFCTFLAAPWVQDASP